MPVTSRGVSVRHRIRLEQTVEAVLDADDLAVDVGRRLDHRTDDRVQPRRVAAARQDAEAREGGAVCRRRHPGEYTSALARLRRGAAPSA